MIVAIARLQARFQTDEYLSTHLNKTINEVVVTYTNNAEINRPRVDHTYDNMPGMKRTFLFMPIREGVTLMRRYSCWCKSCMRAWAPGEGTMDTNYRCQDCESTELRWEEKPIGRTDATGISNARQRSLAKARELTRQLRAHFEKTNQPLWVAVQNRGEDDADQCVPGLCTTLITDCQVSPRSFGLISWLPLVRCAQVLDWACTLHKQGV